MRLKRPEPCFSGGIGSGGMPVTPEGNGYITSGSRDFETGEILVQIGSGRPEIGASGWGLAGSLQLKAFESSRYKVLQHNALCRRVSGCFITDNLRVGWVRYGLESVRGPNRFRIPKS